MKRIPLVAFLAVAILTSAAQGQLDDVRFVNKTTKKEDQTKGNIDQESPAGVKVKQRTDVTLIPAADIVQITYHSASVSAIDYRAPFGKEARALTPGTKEDARKTFL